jgi:xanthine/uracil permease
MDGSFIHADVFFFVSTVLLTAFAVIFIVALIYLLTLIGEAKAVVRIIRNETENVAADLGALRAKIKEGKAGAGLLALVSGLWSKRKRKK